MSKDRVIDMTGVILLPWKKISSIPIYDRSVLVKDVESTIYIRCYTSHSNSIKCNIYVQPRDVWHNEDFTSFEAAMQATDNKLLELGFKLCNTEEEVERWKLLV